MVPSGPCTYVFLPGQSNLILTGGFWGTTEHYPISGCFQLTVDPNNRKASFLQVDATAVDQSPMPIVYDLNDVFNLTHLRGSASYPFPIWRFGGQTKSGDGVDITVSFDGDLIRLSGEEKPPSGADFFYFMLDAVAQRKYGGGTGEPNDPYLIYTPEQMNAIGAEPNDWSKHFKLMADIDLGPVHRYPVQHHRQRRHPFHRRLRWQRPHHFELDTGCQ